MENIFKCSGNTNANKLAAAVMRGIQNDEQVSIRCLGANAINQAVKALCIIRGMGITIGKDISFYSIFDMEYKDNENLTFIKFYLIIKNLY